MRLHYLQHVHFEGLGSIEAWAKKSGIKISSTRLFNNEVLPSFDDFDCLIVLGGPMNIHEEASYPWLTKEKHFIHKTIFLGKHVLGICLGAQLIADILGAKVYPNRYKEIGWFPIQLKKEIGPPLVDIFPDNLEVMHWHGDTFNLPTDSILFASSDACRNQGFIYKNKVIALQFHLETTKTSLESLIANCGDEIIDAPFIQKPTVMLEDDLRIKTINKVMDKLLDYWSQPVLEGEHD